MSCNACAKPFTLLRKEKGCPNCGFSYCSKCLEHKIFVKKINAEAKVCSKCKNSEKYAESKKIEPPDAYYKRLGQMKDDETPSSAHKNPDPSVNPNTKDQEILDRLHKLKEDSKRVTTKSSEQEIADRLQKIKGDVPKTSDEELQVRLARLRGVPLSVVKSPSVLPPPDTRSEQEQADDLLKQYMEQTKIDSTYKDEFDALVSNIETRLNTLKGAEGSTKDKSNAQESRKDCNNAEQVESEDEDETVRKILEKEAALDTDELPPSTNDELPFCEICNEDASLRCLGCKYLFCKRCFMEHRDEDDGCDRYEPYTPPKNASNI